MNMSLWTKVEMKSDSLILYDKHNASPSEVLNAFGFVLIATEPKNELICRIERVNTTRSNVFPHET